MTKPLNLKDPDQYDKYLFAQCSAKSIKRKPLTFDEFYAFMCKYEPPLLSNFYLISPNFARYALKDREYQEFYVQPWHEKEAERAEYAARARNPIRAQLLQTSKEFVADFKPPDYLIVGVFQRRFIYAITAPTGSGKTAVVLRIAAHVDQGLELCGKKVRRGRVIYFAGENPDDVRCRWIKQCEDMGVDPTMSNVVFMAGTTDLRKMRAQIDEEVKKFGDIALVIIDTNAAYFTGDDENSRTQLGDHARMLRTFCDLPGGPTVLVTCHPTKNPDIQNMVPAGGGSFLNEIDGNLAAIKSPDSMIVEVQHNKWRGLEFDPLYFKLVPCTSELLKDSAGELLWTVIAKPVTDEEQQATEVARRDRKSEVLLLLHKRKTGLSYAEVATALDWKNNRGEPNRRLAQSVLTTMSRENLVEKKLDHYELTNKGKKIAIALETANRPEQENLI